MVRTKKHSSSLSGRCYSEKLDPFSDMTHIDYTNPVMFRETVECWQIYRLA